MVASDADDDDLLDLLGPLDPARREHPPAPGSDRYRSILELAMHTETTTTPRTTTAVDPGSSTWPPARRQRRRAWRFVAATAAASLVAAGAVVALQANDAPTAEAAVAEAADTMSGITSLEGELTTTEPGGGESTSWIRADGGDYEIVGETHYADGHTEASTYTVIDDTGYETVDGQTTSTPLGPEDRLAPFGESSAAVISAALEGSDVSQQEHETVDGVTTTRYDLRLTDRSIRALSALTPSELAWFELEYPRQVQSLRVWVADDLIHQIEIVHRDHVTRTRFFNIGGDVTITAPPGPHLPTNPDAPDA